MYYFIIFLQYAYKINNILQELKYSAISHLDVCHNIGRVFSFVAYVGYLQVINF
jgi:hypothetical protein